MVFTISVYFYYSVYIIMTVKDRLLVDPAGMGLFNSQVIIYMEETKVWTDGSCQQNPGKGGWAFAVDKMEYGTGTSENTTSNIMEMTAVIEAIAYCKHEFPLNNIEIYSDSRYCVEGFNSWMHTWQKRGWTKKGNKPLKNLELWQYLYGMRDNVTLHWVKAHNGDEMNEFVDQLAGEYYTSVPS